MKHIKLALLASSLLAIHGCGGGGSSTESDPVYQISGKVIDGYIANATGCADFNRNSKCDAGEPATETSYFGGYSLNSSQDLSGVPILVLGKANTYDTDNPSEFLPNLKLETFVGLSDAKGALNVTPFSTLLASSLKVEPVVGVPTIREQIVSAFGLPAGTSLSDDFESSGNIAVGNVSRVLGASILKAQEDLKAALATGNFSQKEADKLNHIAMGNALNAVKKTVQGVNLNEQVNIAQLKQSAEAATPALPKDPEKLKALADKVVTGALGAVSTGA